jgi:hypothetical protein
MGRQQKTLTPITKLHETQVDNIKDRQKHLPELKEKLSSLQELIKDPDFRTRNIIAYKDTVLEIDELSKKISLLEKELNEYYLRNGRSLIQYSYEQQQPHTIIRNGLSILRQNQSLVDRLRRTNINDEHSHLRARLTSDYVHVTEAVLNDENYCENCQILRNCAVDETYLVCPKCGSQSSIFIRPEKPSAKDPPTENRNYEYKRFGHFCKWLDNLQGKEKAVIPDGILKLVKDEHHKQGKLLEDLDENEVKEYLSKYRMQDKSLSNYKEHATRIVFLLTGIPPIQIPPDIEHSLKLMFLAIQKPYDMFKGNRKNLSGYNYVIYKFFQLLGYDEFLPKLKLHKNKMRTYDHDKIWKQICEYMGGPEKGWEFIGSYGYVH